MPARPTSSNPLTSNELMIAGLLMAVLFAGLMGGWLASGLVGGFALALAHLGHKQQLQIRLSTEHHEKLQRHLLASVDVDELATLKLEGDLREKDLYDFLTTIKKTYGGEFYEKSARSAAQEQEEAVAPGITLTLAYDLEIWFAKLIFAGDTSKRFLDGGYTQWKGRGKTPQEAIAMAIARCVKSRRQELIHEYAERWADEVDAVS